MKFNHFQYESGIKTGPLSNWMRATLTDNCELITKIPAISPDYNDCRAALFLFYRFIFEEPFL